MALDGERPLPPERVHALWGSDSVDQEPKITAEGLLQLPRLPAGKELLRLAYIPEQGPLLISSVETLELTNGERRTLSIQMKPTVRLEGRLDASVPRPVKNGRVVVQVIGSTRNQEVKWQNYALVREDGTFAIEGLPAGEVQVIALCDGYIAKSGTPPDSAKGQQFIPHDVRPQVFPMHAAKNEIVVEMTPAESCRIKVLGPDDRPVVGAQCIFFPMVYWWGGGAQVYCSPLESTAEKLRDPNAWIESRSREPELLFAGTTDADGIAVIKNLPISASQVLIEDERFELPIRDGYRSAKVELKAGKQTDVTVKVQAKGTQFLGPAPNAAAASDEQAIRQVVGDFVEAATKSDVAGVLRTLLPTDANKIQHYIEDAKKLLAIGVDLTDLRSMVVSPAGKALAATDFFDVKDKKFKGLRCVVYHLVKHGDKWLIHDIDLDDVDGLRTAEEALSVADPQAATSNDLPDEQKIRQVVGDFVEAATKSDVAGVLRTLLPTDANKIQHYIEDTKKLLAIGVNLADLRSVVVSPAGKSLAATDFFDVRDKKYKGTHCVVYHLVNHDDRWLIHDIDLDDVDRLHAAEEALSVADPQAAASNDLPADEAAIAEWLKQLAKPDSAKRIEAMQRLRQVGPQASPATEALVALLADEKLGREARLTLAHIGEPAVPALIAALKSDDDGVRWWAAQALEEIGPAAKAAIPALIASFEDPAHPVKNAASALAGMGTLAMPQVMAILADPNSSPDARVGARVHDRVDRPPGQGRSSPFDRGAQRRSPDGSRGRDQCAGCDRSRGQRRRAGNRPDSPRKRSQSAESRCGSSR